MLIAWTTVATRAEADKLAGDIIARNLAACVQVEGPITSHYRWQDKIEQAEEYRLCLKFLPDQLSALEANVLTHHSYATPEWVVVRAEHVGEKYLSWALGNPHSPPL
ncbi:MAG: divalent-cation tolerance protein CutA [Opitutaceae bacterium]|nr:divalent-cation tolerance protein CutA [Opitutaceae bacterium]MBP9911830.1 divalent-cation tolerance protein CutA [Opitutaceae bacterium]